MAICKKGHKNKPVSAHRRSTCKARSTISFSNEQRKWNDRFKGDRYVPPGSAFWRFLQTNPCGPAGAESLSPLFQKNLKSLKGRVTKAEQNNSSLARRDSSVSLASSPTRSFAEGMLEYLKMLYGETIAHARLSSALKRPDVMDDQHGRRVYHSGMQAARQYDLTQPRVLDMLRHMYERFDTVSCYSMGLVEVGMIVYYLKPYTLGLASPDQGWGTASLGGPRFEARVHMKGRFGIVVNKYANTFQVAEVTTFGMSGLESKSREMWPEYVGLRDAGHKDFHNPSPNKALEVANACCEILPQSSVHLVTDKISLNNQILIAGWITHDSMQRLCTMIKKTGVKRA